MMPGNEDNSVRDSKLLENPLNSQQINFALEENSDDLNFDQYYIDLMNEKQ